MDKDFRDGIGIELQKDKAFPKAKKGEIVAVVVTEVRKGDNEGSNVHFTDLVFTEEAGS